MNTATKIQIMQAFVEGKTIETKDKRLTNSKFYAPLSSDNEPLWNWESLDYRIKPEPMEIQVWCRPDGTPIALKYNWSTTESSYTLKTFVEKV